MWFAFLILERQATRYIAAQAVAASYPEPPPQIIIRGFPLPFLLIDFISGFRGYPKSGAVSFTHTDSIECNSIKRGWGVLYVGVEYHLIAAVREVPDGDRVVLRGEISCYKEMDTMGALIPHDAMLECTVTSEPNGL